MLDFDAIGKRIREQRKHILRISQEKMAEDLNMYQADISNIEKGKSGSGITDVTRLDEIARYFGMPLETLLFGKKADEVPSYVPGRADARPCDREIPAAHREKLARLMGYEREMIAAVPSVVCGPFRLYDMTQVQELRDARDSCALVTHHIYTFLGDEVVSATVAARSTVMQHVYRPQLEMLMQLIPFQVFDVLDVWRTLDPYWAMWQYSDKGEQEAWLEKLYARMDELCELGEDRPVVYIESAYVREDCRRHGLFRMTLDYLRRIYEGAIYWLNMEPTSGQEMEEEKERVPTFTVSELGQISLNAAIAEHVGFTVDADTWRRNAETVGDDGSIRVQPIRVRKCAYYLPPEIRELLKRDGDLVARGRALQRIAQTRDGTAGQGMVTVRHGSVDGKAAVECEVFTPAKGQYYVTAVAGSGNGRRYIVSYGSLLRDGKARIKEEYPSLSMAKMSEAYQDILLADSLLQGDIVSEENGCGPDSERIGFIVERNWYRLIGAEEYILSEKISGENVTMVTQYELSCYYGEKKGQSLYALICRQDDKAMYMLTGKGMQQAENIFSAENVICCLPGEEALAGSQYETLFRGLQEAAGDERKI